jgi:transposase
MVDTDGRGLTLDTHPASIQDRDGAPPLMRASRGRWPFVQLAFMDSVYAGDRLANATAIHLEILRKPKGQVGFAVHARGWVVERFFAWIGRNRRLAKDFEAAIALPPCGRCLRLASAFVYAASVVILLRRIAGAARDSGRTLSGHPKQLIHLLRGHNTCRDDRADQRILAMHLGHRHPGDARRQRLLRWQRVRELPPASLRKRSPPLSSPVRPASPACARSAMSRSAAPRAWRR